MLQVYSIFLIVDFKGIFSKNKKNSLPKMLDDVNLFVYLLKNWSFFLCKKVLLFSVEVGSTG